MNRSPEDENARLKAKNSELRQCLEAMMFLFENQPDDAMLWTGAINSDRRTYHCLTVGDIRRALAD
jgi:hypothetical protein